MNWPLRSARCSRIDPIRRSAAARPNRHDRQSPHAIIGLIARNSGLTGRPADIDRHRAVFETAFLEHDADFQPFGVGQ